MRVYNELEKRRKNCRRWVATYKNVQGKTQLSEYVTGTEEEAQAAAEELFGKGDGWNTFVNIKPTWT